jgi:hypothetical protein
MREHRGRALLSGAGLAGATVGLYVIGRGPLGHVPWTQPRRLVMWWHIHGTLFVTFGLLRETLFWIGCYLVLVWALTLLGSRRPSSPLFKVVAYARVPGGRLALRAVLGLAAAGSVWTAGAEPSFAAGDGGTPGPASTTPATGASAAPVLRYVGPGRSLTGGPVHTQGPSDAPQPGSAPATGPRSGPLSGTGTTATPPATPVTPAEASPPPGLTAPFSPLPAPPGATAPSEPGPVAPAPAFSPPKPVTRGQGRRRSTTSTPRPAATQPDGNRRPADIWVVRPGDNLWSIAEATLTDAWGHAPDRRDLGPYWWRVVQVNRPNLPNPADPNLLLPGDRVTLPPLPAGPTQF